ncbi:hypothetical protein PV721_25275 [Streptomyces sp. MB09-01]|uniref:hypothetical protein n=1 Tax=Streptomyces sp. MB09-01 TaxID=3028666 RepID=UPI0029AF6851|nr:hypothetical protein [Streptomyces sp. MB09-01]MDX3537621.1 hypothetical protein [Streptomyces sp. MB09-01]
MLLLLPPGQEVQRLEAVLFLEPVPAHAAVLAVRREGAEEVLDEPGFEAFDGGALGHQLGGHGPAVGVEQSDRAGQRRVGEDGGGRQVRPVGERRQDRRPVLLLRTGAGTALEQPSRSPTPTGSSRTPALPAMTVSVCSTVRVNSVHPLTRTNGACCGSWSKVYSARPR